jgi:NADP-dependent 3-hydroxy acid dehydrogenase YdfG
MKERTILITGASTGIGAATARAAVEAGWKVALVARSEENLTKLVDEFGAETAIALPCDVTREGDIAQALKKAAAFGRLEAIFANAGLGSTAPGIEGGELDNWRQMVDVNIWGVMTSVHHALPLLRETKGHVILTGSNAGRRAIQGSIYGATKWFVHGFYENLAPEMAAWGGRCTLLAPGMVDTPFFDSPKPNALAPMDVARAVVFALDQPKGVNIGELQVTPL